MENKETHKTASLKKKRKSTFSVPNLLLGFMVGASLAGIVRFDLISLAFSNADKPDTSGMDMAMDYPKSLKGLSQEDEKDALAYLQFKYIRQSFMPSGIPAAYGEELDVSFDNVQDAINKLSAFGPTYGSADRKIVLSGSDFERYKSIGSKIACEYCCSVRTLVKSDGSAACGCDHSIMMRGLSAYLIKDHSEMTDEQILNELYKWKITFFPKQMLSARLFEMQKQGAPGVKELLETFPDFLPQMVGGC